MRWISEKLFGKKRTYDEEFASNLYDALVLDGGPSAEAENHIDASALEIPLDKLERFSAKRLIMLEVFLFVATNVATMPDKEDTSLIFQTVHPLSMQMAKLIQAKWKQRGIEVKDFHEVGKLCFDEYMAAMEKPFKWGRGWLDEFYSNSEKSGEYYISWTEQCLKEFKAMKLVVERHT